MSDPSPDVRRAAANNLKKIDPKIQGLAVQLALAYPLHGRQAADPAPIYAEIIRLEEGAEPLTPLLLLSATFSAMEGNSAALGAQLDVLGHIANNDDLAYKVMLSGLDHMNPDVRLHAMKGIAGMKDATSAVPKIIWLLSNDRPQNQVAAIEMLTRLADPSNKDKILAAVRTAPQSRCQCSEGSGGGRSLVGGERTKAVGHAPLLPINSLPSTC